MTKEEIIRTAEEENVRYIKLQFTDMLGTIKSVEIPVSKLEEALDGKSCSTVRRSRDSSGLWRRICISTPIFRHG